MRKDILYSFRRCPYAIRVRWALLICEINVELREVDLKNKPFDFLNSSSTKTIPLLVKKNNEIIEESLEIILDIPISLSFPGPKASISPPKPLGPDPVLPAPFFVSSK